MVPVLFGDNIALTQPCRSKVCGVHEHASHLVHSGNPHALHEVPVSLKVAYDHYNPALLVI